MKLKFIVRGKDGSEESYETVQEAFSKGGACGQSADVRIATVRYPACFVEDEEGRRYGPVLRP